MKRPIVFLGSVLGLALALVLMIGWTTRNRVKTSAHFKVADAASAQPETSKLPDSKLYWIVFQHIALLNQKAEEEEAKGADGSKYRSRYQTFAHLTKGQASILDTIALDTYAQVKRMDARAKKIVDEIRSRTPGGLLQPGEKPPSVPEELVGMKIQREQLIISGYEKLRSAFGQSTFAQFDKYLRDQIGPHVTSIDPKSLGPTDSREPRLMPQAGRAK